MRHQKIINKMTPEQKAAFLSGAGQWNTREFPALNISAITFSDGPSGIRKQAGTGDHLGLNPSMPATCYPCASTIANSWDIELANEVGKSLGEEAGEQGVDVLLGPGLNIKRNPLCGRNFEYFSEDPYLSGKMAASVIRGIQDKGVAACPKHFAVNNQETKRMAINSVLDERALQEIYLTGFEIAVKEGKPRAIMSAYNRVNGFYAHENEYLLKEVLRDTWKFDGIVVSDWGGSNDSVLAVQNGGTLEMPTPGYDSARQILHSVENGKLSQKELDERVDELLDLVLSAGRNRTVKRAPKIEKESEENVRHLLAKKAATESIVLLKNEEQILPLKKGTKVAVIGDFAFVPRYQGAGSSLVNVKHVDSIYEVISDYDLEIAGMQQGYGRDGKVDENLQQKAIDVAKNAEVVLYFAGLTESSESEGLDRKDLKIPNNQISLLKLLAQVNQNLVCVISAGAVIEMDWEQDCRAILYAGLAGQAGAGAMLDILTGKYAPSGKLSETIPVKYEDTPSCRFFLSEGLDAEYRESIYVGYRYYDKAKMPVRYPFGYGLSYTQFTYSDLRVNHNEICFQLANTGKVDGAEIAQLYIALPDATVFRPEKELKAFKKVFLKAGESRRVVIPLDDKTFRYWNVKTGKWEVEEGTYWILVGASSADIRLKGQIDVEGSGAVNPYRSRELPSYYSGEIANVSEAEFQKLLRGEGHYLPQKCSIDINDPVSKMQKAKGLISRLIGKCMAGSLERSFRKGIPNLNLMFQYNMSFRAIAKMTGGMISMKMVRGMVQLMNLQLFRGVWNVISGFVGNMSGNLKYGWTLKKQNQWKKKGEMKQR